MCGRWPNSRVRWGVYTMGVTVGVGDVWTMVCFTCQVGCVHDGPLYLVYFITSTESRRLALSTSSPMGFVTNTPLRTSLCVCVWGGGVLC